MRALNLFMIASGMGDPLGDDLLYSFACLFVGSLPNFKFLYSPLNAFVNAPTDSQSPFNWPRIILLLSFEMIDIDNLLKFVMDSLQKARIIDNDSQALKVSMMKATGKANKIDLKTFRHFLVDPSKYVYDGIAVYRH